MKQDTCPKLKMTREVMLQKLRTVTFTLIDPSREWKDIGFTERDIWVNAKGYGWISCDEPTAWCEVHGPGLEKWLDIRKKLSTEDLLVEDIQGTDFVDLLSEITYGDFDPEFDNPCDYLRDLLDLPAEELQWIYAMDTFDGWQFFASEESFKKAYERDWCHVSWDELSNEMLNEWINRLTLEGILCGEYLVVCSTEDIFIDFQEFIKSLDSQYLDSSVDNAAVDTYVQEASKQLREYIIDNEADVFYDILWKLYSDGKQNGNISYCDAYHNLIAETKENIHKEYGDAYVKLLIRKADESVQAAFDISVEDILLEFLESETECGEFDAIVGKYVESSLFKFLNSSKWHCGFRHQNGTYAEVSNASECAAISDKSHPILWFGPDNTVPLAKWSVIPGEEHGFRYYDQWELLEYLVDDCNDCFSTWYLAECGYDLPDMEEILSECPIEISDDDTPDIINIRFEKYFNGI